MVRWSMLPDDCTALILTHYKAHLHHRMMLRELNDAYEYMRRQGYMWSVNASSKLYTPRWRAMPLWELGCLNRLLENERHYNELQATLYRYFYLYVYESIGYECDYLYTEIDQRLQWWDYHLSPREAREQLARMRDYIRRHEGVEQS